MIAALVMAVQMAAPPPGCGPGAYGRVGCCSVAPRLVSRYDEPYRAVARRRGLRGIVILQLAIERDGHVCSARVLRGLDPEFDRAALAAVARWRFRPALDHRGKPVAMLFNVMVKSG
jgi:TonB family protein